MLSFVMDKITAQDVSDSIDNITSHSAPGVDGVSPKFIKLAKPILSPYLVSLFNKCVRQEIFPHDFKLAHVIPISKTFLKSLEKFRPISLLPVFSKVQYLKNFLSQIFRLFG